jgi:hypothetical protein
MPLALGREEESKLGFFGFMIVVFLHTNIIKSN